MVSVTVVGELAVSLEVGYWLVPFATVVAVAKPVNAGPAALVNQAVETAAAIAVAAVDVGIFAVCVGIAVMVAAVAAVAAAAVWGLLELRVGHDASPAVWPIAEKH